MANFPPNRPPDRLSHAAIDRRVATSQRHLARFVVEVIDGLDLDCHEQKLSAAPAPASYHPAPLLGFLVYGYATGVFSSRKLERATYDSVAFRFIAANDHPDHDTIATFRRRFLKDIEALFVKVLLLAHEMGGSQDGHGGTGWVPKIHANASRHSALSHYEHAGKIEAQLKATRWLNLLAKAEAADQADIPDGISVPEELARREDRLEKLAVARAKIEARAKERYAWEMADHEAKLAARGRRRRPRAKGPAANHPNLRWKFRCPRIRSILTDEESAHHAGRGWRFRAVLQRASGRRRGQYVDSRARCCPGRERQAAN